MICRLVEPGVTQIDEDPVPPGDFLDQLEDIKNLIGAGLDGMGTSRLEV